MKKLILSIILGLCSLGAQAVDKYYCRCDTGASTSPACVAGSDANSGLSAALAKSTAPTESDFNSAAAGDRFLFCRGGAWTGLSAYNFENTNVSAASPLTLDAYTASFGATVRPILSWAANVNAVTFGNFEAPDFSTGNSVDDRGYVFRGLHLRAEGDGNGNGFTLRGMLSDLMFDDLRIDGFFKQFLFSAYAAAGRPINRVTIQNSVIENALEDGILGAASDRMLVLNNTFTNNNRGTTCSAGFCHTMYLGGDIASTGGVTRLTVRGNTLTNNSVQGGTACSGGNLTIHGQLDQVVIEDNVITETTTSTACGGIALRASYATAETMTRTVVRGNTLVGSYGASGGIFTDFSPGVVIENNRVIDNISGQVGGAGIVVATNGDALDQKPDNAVVRNNTCYMLYGNGPCFSMAQRSGHTFINNLAYTGASSASTCFSHGVLGNYSVWNNNHCYRAGSGNWSSTYTTLANAQAAGFDANGSQGDPLFNSAPSGGNSWDLSVQAGSPVVSTGTNTSAPARDVLWCMRKNPPDKGAHDRGATPCQTIRAPVNVR